MRYVRNTVVLSALLAATFSGAASAEIETDRSAGVCASYFTLLQRPVAARQALAMADNQDRALQFAMNELLRIEALRDRGAWDEDAERHYAFRAESACRRIGMRPGDYSN